MEREEARRSMPSFVEWAFENMGRPRGSPNVNAAEEGSEPEEVDRDRWEARVLPHDSAVAVIRKLKPALANIKPCDTGLYGYFKVEYGTPLVYVRSYSWTGRGPTPALKLALYCAWKQVTDEGGHFPEECKTEIEKIDVG